tara:strand:- start:157 stop:267 length:111 start_codon:yes stop_codon:yes gene_type:complete
MARLYYRAKGDCSLPEGNSGLDGIGAGAFREEHKPG